MSVIATYARLSSNAIETCRQRKDWLEALYSGTIADCEVVDVDKACDGLVWLLSRLPASRPDEVAGTGFAVRRSFAPMLRGESGEKEPFLKAPYGPASSLSIQQVQDFAAWLSTIKGEQLRKIYDPVAMEADDIYPNIWEEGPEVLEEYLLPNLQRLQEFFSRATEAGQQVLVFFT